MANIFNAFVFFTLSIGQEERIGLPLFVKVLSLTMFIFLFVLKFIINNDSLIVCLFLRFFKFLLEFIYLIGIMLNAAYLKLNKRR